MPAGRESNNREQPNAIKKQASKYEKRASRQVEANRGPTGLPAPPHMPHPHGGVYDRGRKERGRAPDSRGRVEHGAPKRAEEELRAGPSKAEKG